MVKGGVWWSCAAQQDASAHVRVCETRMKVRSWKPTGQLVPGVASDGLLCRRWNFGLVCVYRAETHLLHDPPLIRTPLQSEREMIGLVSRLLPPHMTGRAIHSRVPSLYLFSNTLLSLISFWGPQRPVGSARITLPTQQSGVREGAFRQRGRTCSSSILQSTKVGWW